MGTNDIEQYIWRDRDRFYRLAFAYVRNQQDALDIVSESIVKALKNRTKLRDDRAIKAWFYSIVVHTAYDFLRKRKRTVYTDEIPDEGTQDRYQDFDLFEALARLSEPLRSVVILRFFEDMKLEEIAEALGENVSTVKTRLYRALRVLKIELAEPEALWTPAGGLYE